MRINSFVKPEALATDIVTLSPEESHHLARVLRVEPGQEMTLFDGQGARAYGTIETVSKKEVTVRITERETVPPPEVDITLIQAVCKPDRFEMILQKAAELGVRTIQPVITANASLPSGKIDKMIRRGETIIRNAAQQCGTAWLPQFLPLKKLPVVFPTIGNSDACFIGSLHPNAKPFKEAFDELRSSGSPGGLALPENATLKGGATSPTEPFTAALIIGPEGDLTEDEVNAAVDAGAIPVTFGKQILRTETAAIFGLSVLVYELC